MVSSPDIVDCSIGNQSYHTILEVEWIDDI